MSKVRLRRLQADHEQLKTYVRRNPRVRIVQTEGNPAEKFQLEYQIRGLRQKDDKILIVKSHLVEITLPMSYPRLPPQCRMLTPVFHPNIAPHAICIGDHWSAGESLTSIVARIGEMISFQSYNVKSPLNGEAARWVDEHEHKLPLDSVSMIVDLERPRPKAPKAEVPAPPVTKPASQTNRDHLVMECAQCQAKLRVPPTAIGRKVRCGRCQSVIHVTAST